MLTQRSSRELWIAFILILLVTIFYTFLVIWFKTFPGAGEFWGHTLGVVGFILMLLTETLYSLRKHSRTARWGRMSAWLDFHIITGLVGPYMVLLHSSWKFNGLAGVVTLMTAVVVVSGFIGRYIYTAVPRTMDGAEVEASVLHAQINTLDSELRLSMEKITTPDLRAYITHLVSQAKPGKHHTLDFFSNAGMDWIDRLNVWRQRSRLNAPQRAQLAQLEQLIRQRRLLARQVQSLALARRLLAVWHAIHIPIGMALFAAAFVHIIAAIYYATLLR